MTVWESGRESAMLDEIIVGRKTIEGRLKCSKFAEYKVGDIIKLRRDVRLPDGTLQDGEPDQVRVQVVAVRQYKTFFEMLDTEDYKKVIPFAKTTQEATDEYDKYYSREDQAKYGVLAIEVAIVA